MSENALAMLSESSGSVVVPTLAAILQKCYACLRQFDESTMIKMVTAKPGTNQKDSWLCRPCKRLKDRSRAMGRRKCTCRCGCRRKPGSRRVECHGCGRLVCPGYCLGLETNTAILCRVCLDRDCDGDPEPWRLEEILESQFYVSLLCLQWQLNVNADHLVVDLLAHFLRP